MFISLETGVFRKFHIVTSMWFDKWCAASPLYNIISSRDIARAGFSRASKVRECIHDGVWSWPNEWLVKYPILNSIPVPILNDDKSDYLEWRSRDGTFVVVNLFGSPCLDLLTPRDNLVSWYDLVWFQACIKHELHLCGFLYFKNDWKGRNVWSRVKHLACLIGSGSSLDLIVSILLPIAKRKSSKSCIGKLVVAAAAYFVWPRRTLSFVQER
ncbi:hypothetical protein Tco_0045235 [Tanacetum coccineum]